MTNAEVRNLIPTLSKLTSDELFQEMRRLGMDADNCHLCQKLCREAQAKAREEMPVPALRPDQVLTSDGVVMTRGEYDAMYNN